MTVCVFTGSATAFNVRQDVSNLGTMIGDAYDAHLVTTDPEAFDGLDSFTIFAGARSSRVSEVRLLRSYLQNENPSVVVQMTDPPIHGTVASLLSRTHDIPVVYRYSGDRFREYRLYSGMKQVVIYGLNNVMGRIPLRFADRYVALGPHGRGRLVAYGAPPSRVHILPPAIDPKRFEGDERAQFDVPDKRKIVLLLGRVSRMKGVNTIERTIKEILDRRPDLQFVFVGDVKERPTVSSQYRDHLTFVGRVCPADVPSYLRRADVLVHPSLTEGVPRAVLESLFAGTPVIARDVGDTASVTENTFKAKEEFVEMVCSFEELKTDDPDPFSVENLKPRYKGFFSHYIEGNKSSTVQ